VLVAILGPAFAKWRHIAGNVVCGTNLKYIGEAITVYANDYDGNYPVLPGRGPWSKRLGFEYYHAEADFSVGGAEEYNSRTISASMYLLVREADMSGKSFVCPKSSQEVFKGENPKGLGIVELWDFGPDPYRHVSYSMHNPYGKYPAHDELSASFAVVGDMSPWLLDGDVVGPGKDGTAPQLIADDWSGGWVEKGLIQAANSSNHGGEGQSVLYGDGHNAFERRSDVGMGHDGIYTYQAEGDDIRIGTNPAARDEENDAKNSEDSFLAI
jgi:hypothetical protein